MSIFGHRIKESAGAITRHFYQWSESSQVSPHSQYDRITLIYYMSVQEFRLTVKFINRLSCFDASYQCIVESHERETDAIYPEHREGKYCSLPCWMIGGSLN